MEAIQDYVTTLHNIEMATLRRQQKNDREREVKEFRDAQLVSTLENTKAATGKAATLAPRKKY